MRGEPKNIPLLGIDRQYSQRHRPDGLCEIMHNVKPSGVGDRIFYEPVHDIEAAQLNLLPGSAASVAFNVAINALPGTVSIDFTVNKPDGSKTTITASVTDPADSEAIANAIFVAFDNVSEVGFPTANISNANHVHNGTTYTTVEIRSADFSQSWNGLTVDVVNNGMAVIYKDDNYNALSSSFSLVFDGGNKEATGEIIRGYWQLRSRKNEKYTISSVEPLNRLILTKGDQIILLNKNESVFTQTLPGELLGFTPSLVDYGRIGEVTTVACSNNSNRITLNLVDDTYLRGSTPETPSIEISQSLQSSNDEYLLPGTYGIRVGYKLKSGEIISLSNILSVAVGFGLTVASGDTVKLSVSVTSLPDLGEWSDQIDSIALLMTDRAQKAYDVWNFYYAEISNELYYIIQELPLSTEESVDIKLKNSDIRIKKLASFDVLNANHDIAGKVLHSYNSRILQGDTQVKFYKPVINSYITTTFGATPSSTSGSGKHIAIVEIQTGQGKYYIESDPFELDEQNVGRLFIRYNFSYPDQRAKYIHFVVETSPGSGAYTHSVSYKMNSHSTCNASVMNNRQGTVNTDQSIPVPEPSISLSDQKITDLLSNPEDKQVSSNRIYVSELDNPFVYRAKNTHYVGDYHTNKIMGMGSNALPISEGQFGQYPLYVFTRNSIHAMEVGGSNDVVFSRINPVSNSLGLVNYHQLTNIGQSLFFVSQDGIQLIGGGRKEKISSAIDEVIDNELSTISLGAITDDNDNYLLVNTSQGVLVYHGGIWTSRDGDFTHLVSDVDESIYISTSECKIEGDAISEINILTHPIDIEASDYLKRFYSLFLRATLSEDATVNLKLYFDYKGTRYKVYDGSQLSNKLRNGSCYGLVVEATINPTSDKDIIEMLQTEVDIRYAHRIRS